MELNLTKEGFLSNYADWSESVAIQLAQIESIELTQAHWDILHFMRDYYEKYQYLPNTRVFTKAIANEFGYEIGNSRYLQTLFPQSPLKYTCKIAGLPKPPTCL
jgi:tRNA 2-thiouridine synthesizing protein E